MGRKSVILCNCLIGFGAHYVQLPDLLREAMTKNILGTDSGEDYFNLLMIVFASCSMLSALAAGFVVGLTGHKVHLAVSLTICIIGQTIFSFGPFASSGDTAYYLMLVGRAVFGLGVGGVYVIQNLINVRWFEKREYCFIFGITISAANLGSIVNLVLPRWVFTELTRDFSDLNGTVTGTQSCLLNGTHNPSQCNNKLGVSLWVGNFWIVTSVMALIAYTLMDDAKKVFLQERERDRMMGGSVTVDSSTDINSDGLVLMQPVKLSDIKAFSHSYWLSIVVLALYTSVLYVFGSNANAYFEFANILANDDAIFASTMGYITVCVCAPLFGLLLDFIGKRAVSVVVGTALGAIVFLLLIKSFDNKTLALALLGVSHALVTPALWSCIQMFGPSHPRFIGVSNGFAVALEMFAMSIVYVGIAAVDVSDYMDILFAFVAIGGVTFILAMVMGMTDRDDVAYYGMWDYRRGMRHSSVSGLTSLPEQSEIIDPALLIFNSRGHADSFHYSEFGDYDENDNWQ